MILCDQTAIQKIDGRSLEDSIRRYCEIYTTEIDRLANAHPDRVHVFSSDALEAPDGQSKILTACGFLNENNVYLLDATEPGQSRIPDHQTPQTPCSAVPNPRNCAVLVPFHREIIPACEEALQELEASGYTVIRRGGVSAIDTARNKLATEALMDGFEETLWIDSDISFAPEAVDQLRRTDFPIVCGIYPKKGTQQFACHLLPGASHITFGKKGGVVEILYGGTGFMLIRRQVYQDIQEKLELPVCNDVFGKGFVPYFQPLIRQHDAGHWYLAEDYSFCERARQVGYSIMADTRIRLWHHGNYAFSWEDAGLKINRFENYTHRRS